MFAFLRDFEMFEGLALFVDDASASWRGYQLERAGPFVEFVEELLSFAALRFLASIEQPSNNLLVFESIAVVL
mgnify:CR=1 FL=1